MLLVGVGRYGSRRIALEREALLSELIEEIEFETPMYTKEQNKWFNSGLKCAACEFIYYSNKDEWNFCPNCGARMDGKAQKVE